MMGADPRLMALPALRKRAEEQARVLFVARYTDAARGHRDWAEGDNERELCIRAHLSLLADLTRPASRDAVARLVAAKTRIKVYALHALLAGAIPYPPEWPTDLCDRVAAAESEGEALTLIALAVLGGAS